MSKVILAAILLVVIVVAGAVFLKTRSVSAPVPISIQDEGKTEPSYEELTEEREPYLEEQSPEDTLLEDEN